MNVIRSIDTSPIILVGLGAIILLVGLLSSFMYGSNTTFGCIYGLVILMYGLYLISTTTKTKPQPSTKTQIKSIPFSRYVLYVVSFVILLGVIGGNMTTYQMLTLETDANMNTTISNLVDLGNVQLKTTTMSITETAPFVGLCIEFLIRPPRQITVGSDKFTEYFFAFCASYYNSKYSKYIQSGIETKDITLEKLDMVKLAFATISDSQQKQISVAEFNDTIAHIAVAPIEISIIDEDDDTKEQFLFIDIVRDSLDGNTDGTTITGTALGDVCSQWMGALKLYPHQFITDLVKRVKEKRNKIFLTYWWTY